LVVIIGSLFEQKLQQIGYVLLIQVDITSPNVSAIFCLFSDPACSNAFNIIHFLPEKVSFHNVPTFYLHLSQTELGFSNLNWRQLDCFLGLLGVL
jgi:hypothetical protein